MSERKRMIRNLTRQTLVAENEHYALKFFERLQGMIGKDFDRNLDCMVFPCCNSIHMFFMSRKLDVIFLDKENRIVKIFTAKPWGIYSGGRNALKVLELPEGSLQKSACSVGDILDPDAEKSGEKVKNKGGIRSFVFAEPAGDEKEKSKQY